MQYYPYAYNNPIIPAPYNLRTEAVSLDYIILRWEFNFDFDIEFGGDFDYNNYLSGFEIRQIQLNAEIPKPPPTFFISHSTRFFVRNPIPGATLFFNVFALTYSGLRSRASNAVVVNTPDLSSFNDPPRAGCWISPPDCYPSGPAYRPPSNFSPYPCGWV